jgi:hypothetical protein
MSETKRALPPMIWMAPSSHDGTHSAHPSHFSSSIWTIMRFGTTKLLVAATFVARLS